MTTRKRKRPTPPAQPVRQPVSRVGLKGLIVGGVLAAVALGIYLVWRPDAKPAAPEVETRRVAPTDPRTTFDTPFRNVRPAVQYVGDDACAGCHRRHATTYRQHPMGRSLAPLAAASTLERYEAAAQNPFETGALRYLVDRRDGHVVHSETVTGASGRALAATEAKVRYAVGSGRRGRSYLIDHDGYLFQSPITWYPLHGRWDLSPSYENVNSHLSRPITPGCLFCHANGVHYAGHNSNRFPPPTFRGFAVGCERCHGPGELHVRDRRNNTAPPGIDDSIVNPAHLTPDLREAVCQQCHLQGEARVLRRGRDYSDFRPGLPLQLFLVDFFKPAEARPDNKFVGAVEQVYASRCYQQSRGSNQLGCISCHDPHELPAADKRVAYFRDRCLTCHAKQGCRLPEPARRERSKDDNCLQCHMPRKEASVVHTTITDHRILRNPDAEAPREPAAWPQPGRAWLEAFLPGRDADSGRDQGIALIEVGRKIGPPPAARPLAETALPMLEAAATDPEDLAALEAYSSALLYLGRPEEALAVCERSLAVDAERETSLFLAATLAAQLQRPAIAREYCEKAIRVNPWMWHYHQLLAGVQVQAQRWEDAARECRAAIALNGAGLPSHQVLTTCLIKLGDRRQAEAEFEICLRLAPPAQHESLRRWFAQQ